jgi:peptidoglycan/xylan/chitin deacetylase (PgdA/CDA1 family)
MINYVKKGIDLPKDSLIITFDDGYKDFYINAYPILNKYSVPTTLFLTTDYISHKCISWWDKLSYIINITDKRELNIPFLGNYVLSEKYKYKVINELISKLKNFTEYKKNMVLNLMANKLNVNYDEKKLCENLFLNWNEVIELSENNILLGAHTTSHPILTKVKVKEARKEILNSKKIIESKIKKEVKIFSYPNGQKEDFNEKIKSILKSCGFTAAVTTIFGSNYPKNKNFDLYSIKRIHPHNLNMLKKQIVSASLYSYFK